MFDVHIKAVRLFVARYRHASTCGNHVWPGYNLVIATNLLQIDEKDHLWWGTKCSMTYIQVDIVMQNVVYNHI